MMYWIMMLAACGSKVPADKTPRTPQAVPDRFVLDAAAPNPPGDTIAGTGCQSTLFDPRDRTGVMLVRSAKGQGDYLVPVGKYGVRLGELLRLDCNTGRIVGIVRR